MTGGGDEQARGDKCAAGAAAGWSLGELARRFDLQHVTGDADMQVLGVCALEAGCAAHLAYAADDSQRSVLARSEAGAVIVPASLAQDAAGAVLVAEHPKLAFARIAALFEYRPDAAGVAASAVVHPQARLAPDACLGANVVIGAGSVVGADVHVGANTVIGDHVTLGAGTRIASNVSIHHHARLGARVRIEANAVIGARGFGLVHTGTAWEAIPQLGSVRLGDDVEVGASSTIDRGALADTVIEDDVRIDNQVHIGHNCHIGAHTVIAGCSGIAGSCTIGAHCMIGGGVGISDHVRITDQVMVTGASQVPRDITEPGVWSSTFRAMPAGQWRRLLARFTQLGQINRRLKRLERAFDDRNQQDNT